MFGVRNWLALTLQAHVYELLDKQGRIAPIVLKAARQVALISDTQREWATGQRLAALGPGESPPLFTLRMSPSGLFHCTVAVAQLRCCLPLSMILIRCILLPAESHAQFLLQASASLTKLTWGPLQAMRRCPAS